MQKGMWDNLRKCTLTYENDWVIFYFHGFAVEAVTERHPEDPRGDLVYPRPCAILEDIETGEVRMASVHCVVFIKE